MTEYQDRKYTPEGVSHPLLRGRVETWNKLVSEIQSIKTIVQGGLSSEWSAKNDGTPIQLRLRLRQAQDVVDGRKE